jgi:hypothetical protein
MVTNQDTSNEQNEIREATMNVIIGIGSGEYVYTTHLIVAPNILIRPFPRRK